MCSADYKTTGNIVIVTLKGELTVQSIKKIKDDFKKYLYSNRYFIFDLNDLNMIDSSGLGYIINCLKAVTPKGGDIKILNLNTQPKIIFEITRVDSIFKIYTNQSEAIKSFKNRKDIR